jgi:hypothetical protein
MSALWVGFDGNICIDMEEDEEEDGELVCS